MKMTTSRLAFRALVLCLFAAPLVSVALADTPAATFVVKKGAAPWSDRVGTWCLAQVPSSLENKGPLPQQSCSSRAIVVPTGAKSILLAVSTRDIADFKAKFPGAQATGDTISVTHPDGSNEIPYTVFKLNDPPATVGDTGLSAGLMLLQVRKSGDA